MARKLLEDDLFTPAEVAKLLQCGVSTVRKWAVAGKLKFQLLPCSRHRRYTRREIYRFAQEHDLTVDFSRLPSRAYQRGPKRKEAGHGHDRKSSN